MAKRPHLTNCLILFSLAIVIRIAIIAVHGFDGLYGQDAFAYYDFAKDILYFAKTLNPPPPFFWSIGYPSQIAIGFAILGTSEWIPLGINLLMGAALPILVYSISLQIGLRSAFAFFAGLIIIFSGQALQSSLVIMSDVPALFWCLLGIISLLHYTKTTKRHWLILCALCVSIACLTRFAYLILLPVYILSILSKWKLHIRWVDLLIALVIGFIPILPQVAFNQINPTPLLNHSWVQGWSPENAISQNFINIDGTFHYDNINAVFYAYPFYDVSYLSPLLSLFILIGVVALLRNRDTQSTIIIIGWIGLPYAFLVGIPYQNIRFALILFPAIAILIGWGLQAIFDTQHKIRWMFAMLSLGGFIHTAVNGIDYANSFVEHHQSEKVVITWLSDKLPANATLYTFGSTLTLEHYTDYAVIEIFYESPNTLKQRWIRGRTDYLLLNIWQIENQWQGRDPQANYHWFRDERGLTEIGKFRNLTLFEMQA